MPPFTAAASLTAQTKIANHIIVQIIQTLTNDVDGTANGGP